MTKKSFDAGDRSMWCRDAALRLLEASSAHPVVNSFGDRSMLGAHAAWERALKLWDLFYESLPDAPQ